MADLLVRDDASGKLVQRSVMDPADVSRGLLEGRYLLPKGSVGKDNRVHITDVDGRVGTVPVNQLNRALREGYFLAEAGDAAQAQIRQTAEGQTALAFAEGAARSATGGVSDALQAGARALPDMVREGYRTIKNLVNDTHEVQKTLADKTPQERARLLFQAQRLAEARRPRIAPDGTVLPSRLEESGADLSSLQDPAVATLADAIAKGGVGERLARDRVAANESVAEGMATIAARKEANPVASTVGEVGGFVASMFTPAGLGVGAVPKGIVGTGATAERIAASLARKATEGKVIPALAGTMVRGTAEGAAVSVASELNEAVLGNVDLTAERVLAAAGSGAAVGGALGLASGAVGLGAMVAARGVAKGSRKLASALSGSAERSAVTDALAKDFDELATKVGQSVKRVSGKTPDLRLSNKSPLSPVEVQEKVAKSYASKLAQFEQQWQKAVLGTPQGAYTPPKVDAALLGNLQSGVAQGEMRGVVSSLREYAAGVPKARAVVEKAAEELDTILAQPVSERSAKAVFRRWSEVQQDLEKLAAKNPRVEEAADLADDFLKQDTVWGRAGREYALQGELRKFPGVDPSLDIPAMLRNTTGQGDATSVVRRRLDQAQSYLREVGNTRVGNPRLAKLQAELDKVSKLSDDVESVIGDSAKLQQLRQQIDGGNGLVDAGASFLEGSWDALLGMAGQALGLGPFGFVAGKAIDNAVRKGAAGSLNKTAMLQRLAGWTDVADTYIQKRVAAWTANQARGAVRGYRPESLVHPATARMLTGSSEERAKAYEERTEALRDEQAALTKPTPLMLQLNAAGMPDLASRVSLVAQGRVQDAMNSAPPNPPQDALSGKRRLPSTLAITKWARAQAIRESPLVALDRLAEGKLTHHEVATLKATHPQIYGQIVQTVTEAIRDGKFGETVSYNKRVQLDTLLGISTLPSTQPTAILAFQNAHADGAEAAASGATADGANPARLSTKGVQLNQLASGMDQVAARP